MRVYPKNNKKKIIIIAAIVTAIIVAALMWFYAFSSNKTDDSSESTSTTSQKKKTTKQKDDQKDSEEPKADTKPEDQSVPHEKEKELPQLYEGDNANTSAGLTGVITAKSVMAGNLIIRNTIDQMVSSGSCELTLSSNGRIVTRSAEIIQNPSSSTCAGFDVPVSELGAGQWNIEIKVTSADKSMTLRETINI